MTSTHRRNLELMNRCAEEVPTSLDRVKVRLPGDLAVRVGSGKGQPHTSVHSAVQK